MTPDINIGIFDYIRHRRFMCAGWCVGVMLFILGWFL